MLVFTAKLSLIKKFEIDHQVPEKCCWHDYDGAEEDEASHRLNRDSKVGKTKAVFEADHTANCDYHVALK